MKTEYLALIVAILIILLALRPWRESMESVDVNGERYNVLSGYKDPQSAASVLAEVNNRMLKYLEYIKTKYNTNVTDDVTNDKAITDAYAAGIVERALRNYNFETLYETKPTGENGTSYTVNKGDELHICVREKDSPKIHKADDIMFVALHELAHMANTKWGHKTDFWRIFKFLLREAAECGALKPVDYSKEPILYCGLRVDYNPLFDNSL